MNPVTPAPEAEQAVAALKFEKIEITSDGTKGGSKVLVNGKAIANMSSLNFSWYASDYCPVSLSYTVRDAESKPGTLEAYTNYRLRCPEPAYANKAVASVEDPSQMVFEFAKASTDEALTSHEAQSPAATRRLWKQL